MGLFLTKIELEELTGYKLASYQVSWLKAQGYYVETNARGTPIITHEQIQEKRRSVHSSMLFKTSHAIENFEPDLSNLQNKIER